MRRLGKWNRKRRLGGSVRDKVAIICGSANGLWEDLAAAVDILPMEAMPSIAALNIAGIFLPHVDDWFITAMDNVAPMAHLRERATIHGDRGAAEVCLHSPGREGLPPMMEGHKYWSIPTKGTIAMFAVRVLSSLGCRRMILAGVPLDDKAGYFYQPPWEAFGMSSESREYWSESSNHIKPYVRSMSGWTRELLGAPDEAWIQGGT